MPVDWSRYPQTWSAIRRRILARATPPGSNVALCEWCGAPNGAVVDRHPDGRWILSDELEGMNSDVALAGGWDDSKVRPFTRIVLTVAHLGVEREDGSPGDKHDKLDCRDENLAALCQRCHLQYDADEHVANAHLTRRVKRVDAGQGVLPGFEGVLERGH